MGPETVQRIKRSVTALLCLVILAALTLPVAVNAGSAPKAVRVGWYESPFNSTDRSGVRSGYAYEYQLKIAAYAGWEYVYVSGSWSDLMQMLKNGEIDMLSDVSYTEERSHEMLFPDLPMGTEEYCVFVTPGNRSITSADYSSLNGKKIGVNKGSIQIGFYKEWAKRHEVEAELVELTGTEVDSVEMLEAGEFDAYITLNAYGDPQRLVPVCKIGSSDFYFAVANGREDLLSDLNSAMSRIQDENPYYNQLMFEKYVQRFGTNAFLTNAEEAWLKTHGTIRVGYQDNYLAFCAKDPETGELTGALKDYLDCASDCISGAHIDFSAIAYPTAAAALDALKRGEIDCVFPSNLGGYDGETMDLIMTPAIMHTDVLAVVQRADLDIFSKKEHVIVAVNEGNPNYNAFLRDNFPEWTAVYFSTTEDCLEAVSGRLADCVLISNYRYNNIARLCDKYKLTTYAVGDSLEYSFAVTAGDTELYSILSKTAGLVPTSTVNSVLSYYSVQDAKLTLSDFVTDNLGFFIAAVLAIVLLIMFFLIMSLRSENKAQKLISATETDDLTELYNRDYFFEYANRMYRDCSYVPRDAISVNIERFHTVNDLNGRAFGDRVLRILGSEARAIAEENEGIAGRTGADRFDIYCRSVDDYRVVFDRLQNKVQILAPGAKITIRMGVMPWQEKLDPVRLFDRAHTACKMARGNYLNHLIVFDENIRERELLDQRLLNDLEHGLDCYEFEVYYQPKYDVSSDTPRLVSAEALVRWRHPVLGIVTPDKFISLFEHCGRIGELDRFVWEQAARQIARWRAHYGITIPVSVNLSRIDVLDPALADKLEWILAENGLEHDALRLEVTESAYTENADEVVIVVEKLRSRGFTVGMDDFGTGYSSLSMLSEMPVDVIKIDRSFISDIENNGKNEHLVALIIGIAKSLNIRVIAVGVETEAQLDLLKKLGCTIVQGYYFSRPLHPSDFESRVLRYPE